MPHFVGRFFFFCKLLEVHVCHTHSYRTQNMFCLNFEPWGTLARLARGKKLTMQEEEEGRPREKLFPRVFFLRQVFLFRASTSFSCEIHTSRLGEGRCHRGRECNTLSRHFYGFMRTHTRHTASLLPAKKSFALLSFSFVSA